MAEHVHTIGHRTIQKISFHASAENLLAGAQFNDALHALSRDNRIAIPKGVYFFRTHQEADQQRIEYLAKNMAALSRR